MVRTFSDHAQLDIPYAILCPVYFLRYPNELASHVVSVDVLAREIITRPRERQRSQNDTISDPRSSRQAALQQQHREEAAGPSRSFWGSPTSSLRSTEGEEDVQHILKTTRLILKKGTLPKWAPSGILRNAESWVLEESEVELDSNSSSSNQRPSSEGRKMKCWTRNLDHTTVMAVTENLKFTEQLPTSMEENTAISNSRLDSTHDVESSVGFTLLQSRIEKFGYQRVRTHVDTSRKGLWMTYSRFLQQRLQEGRMNAIMVNALQGQSGIEIVQHVLPPSKRAKLFAALRPPFLDGDFVGPIARLRQRAKDVRIWWKGLVRGGTADKEHMRIRSAQIDDDGRLSPMERLRKRFLSLRDGHLPNERSTSAKESG